MEDSKDEVQENLLANGGRCCEYVCCGFFNALMLPLFSSEYSRYKKGQPPATFFKNTSTQLPFFSKLAADLSSIRFTEHRTVFNI